MTDRRSNLIRGRTGATTSPGQHGQPRSLADSKTGGQPGYPRWRDHLDLAYYDEVTLAALPSRLAREAVRARIDCLKDSFRLVAVAPRSSAENCFHRGITTTVYRDGGSRLTLLHSAQLTHTTCASRRPSSQSGSMREEATKHRMRPLHRDRSPRKHCHVQ